jgi:putative ABC transport system permease protein
METLWQDIKYGVRTLAKNPGFTAIAVLTLALGIGANTAIFSVVNGVLLRPLPYKDPGHLFMLWARHAESGAVPQQMSYQDFEDIRDQSAHLESAAAIITDQSLLTGAGEPLVLDSLRVTPSFFETLGVQPVRGRSFLREEGEPGKDNVVVLSHRLWQSHFGADPGIIGRAVRIDGQSETVVGVLPADFHFVLNRF